MMPYRNRFTNYTWDQFSSLNIAARADLFNDGDRAYHTLISQQFDRPMLDRLCRLATRVRLIAKSKPGVEFLQGLLSHKRVMIYFSQPSSRTFLSFYAACQILGCRPAEVRDSSTSSEMKGESPEDTIRTFSSYFDMLIMRTERAGLAEKMAWILGNTGRPVPIINAGSGKDQHPTQALLDVYTLQRSFERSGGIDGKTVVFCGDLLRGRTVRSLAMSLTQYRDVRMLFVTHPRLQIGDDLRQALTAAGVDYELSEDFEVAIPLADAIYMTRIQDEWDENPGDSKAIDTTRYQFKHEHLALLKRDAVLMHPLPRREEIAIEVDADPRAVYWRQVRNGMWIRAALMAETFGIDGVIDKYFRVNHA
ncbi:MAG: aspartate carbamoyltransferase [Lentisphaeria bacterium]|nr:aspartate carbamoyltransferase [Lentisphaeria bacterium]